MIDNIRFNFELEENNAWLKRISGVCSLKEEWSGGKGSAYRGKLYRNEGQKSFSDKKTLPYLSIEIVKMINKPMTIILKNSLRKWYFGTEVIGDFTKIEFLECLGFISDKLEIPKNILLGAKVTRVEYGANLHFKPNYRCFFHCIHEHKELKKKCVYGDETLEFKGENRSVIFYDKVTEQKGKSFKAKNQKKLNNVTLLLRYEIKVNKMSGCPEKPYMSFVKDIIDNWKTIVNLWKNELNEITFVNDMSPEIYDYLEKAKIKPMKEYLIYLGIKSIGLNKLGLIIQNRMDSSYKKDLTNNILPKFSEFDLLMGQENFENNFKKTVNLRAKALLK